MPLNKLESYERHAPISFRNWKNNDAKIIAFLNDGRDVNTENGPSVVFDVKVGDNISLNTLWVRPGGALHIGINEYLPLKGKTLKITKTIIKGQDATKGTRYTAVQVK